MRGGIGKFYVAPGGNLLKYRPDNRHGLDSTQIHVRIVKKLITSKALFEICNEFFVFFFVLTNFGLIFRLRE